MTTPLEQIQKLEQEIVELRRLLPKYLLIESAGYDGELSTTEFYQDMPLYFQSRNKLDNLTKVGMWDYSDGSETKILVRIQ